MTESDADPTDQPAIATALIHHPYKPPTSFDAPQPGVFKASTVIFTNTAAMRARERGETTGFMKVLVDAHTERILGAALLGIEADEVVQLLLLAMAANLPYTRIQQTMWIHPTVTELLPTLFDGLKPLS